MKCYEYRFFAVGSIEEKVYQRQLSKEGLQNVVNDATASIASDFSSDELKKLFRLRDDTRCDTHDTIGCSRCLKRKSAICGPCTGDVAVPDPISQIGEPKEDDLQSWVGSA